MGMQTCPLQWGQVSISWAKKGHYKCERLPGLSALFFMGIISGGKKMRSAG